MQLQGFAVNCVGMLKVKAITLQYDIGYCHYNSEQYQNNWFYEAFIMIDVQVCALQNATQQVGSGMQSFGEQLSDSWVLS